MWSDRGVTISRLRVISIGAGRAFHQIVSSDNVGGAIGAGVHHFSCRDNLVNRSGGEDRLNSLSFFVWLNRNPPRKFQNQD